MCFGFVSNLKAEITFRDGQFPELVTSARALAIGNAYVAGANDAASVFYNPAGLGSIREWHFHLSNLTLEWNKNWQNVSSGGKVTDAAGNFPQAFSLDGLRKLQVDGGVQEKPTFSRFSLAPNFTTRYLSFGYLYSKKTRTQVRDDDGTDKFEYADRLDHGPYVAANLSLFGGVFKLGVMGVTLFRKEAFGSVDAADTITLEDDDYKSGTAYTLLGGAKLTLPITWLPTLAIKSNNLNSAKFHGAAGKTPDKLRHSVDLGFSLTPQIGNILRLHMEVNYKDFGDEYNMDTKRKIMAGMELNIARVMFFRFGISDGFGSFGIGMSTKRLKVDLTTYAVDLSDSSLRGIEDRRFIFGFSSGI